MSDAALAETARLYSGHEIACHTVSHGWCANMPAVSVLNETLKDRLILEKIAGYPVMRYVIPERKLQRGINIRNEKLRNCVFKNYPVKSQFHPSGKFYALAPDLPPPRSTATDWTNSWEILTRNGNVRCFYTWGHSHELRTEQDWDNMRRICETLAGNEKIWYATNIEIYRYMTDCRRLVVSADENIIYNPTATDIWIEKDKKDIIKVPAGTTVN